jgi:hypothetical protein
MSYLEPSPEELAAVQRLKSRLAAEQVPKLTDTAVLRFLRGRKHDEEKALKALNRHLQWREENEVDDIDKNISQFEKELKSQTIVVHGSDKDGRPSIFVFARRHNKNERDLEQVRKVIIYTLENTLKKARPHEERILICFDLSEFSYSCMDYDAVKLLVHILQFNYPETLERALVINAPLLFSACWAVIRPWLDPITVSKVHFTKKAELVNYFPASDIPHDL